MQNWLTETSNIKNVRNMYCKTFYCFRMCKIIIFLCWNQGFPIFIRSGTTDSVLKNRIWILLKYAYLISYLIKHLGTLKLKILLPKYFWQGSDCGLRIRIQIRFFFTGSGCRWHEKTGSGPVELVETVIYDWFIFISYF